MSQDISRFVSSSPRQTFVLSPAAVILFELLIHHHLRVRPRWLPLLLAGYGLYRYAGHYRDRKGAGSRGFANAPRRLITDGPYALTRNPMYLGHLIFMTGLVAVTRSPLALVLAARAVLRFTARVRVDEERLDRVFGDEYRAYRARVPRWIGIPTDVTRSRTR